MDITSRPRDPGRSERYPRLLRVLHWTVAAGVVVQIALGWTAERAADPQAGSRLLHVHYQLGIVLLALMVLRASGRLAQAVPAAAADDGRWARRLAACVHAALYVLLFLLLASGYVIWVWMAGPMDVLGIAVPRLFTPPADDETLRALAWYVHYSSAWALAALIALHVAAALWHECVLRDRLIRRRML